MYNTYSLARAKHNAQTQTNLMDIFSCMFFQRGQSKSFVYYKYLFTSNKKPQVCRVDGIIISSNSQTTNFWSNIKRQGVLNLLAKVKSRLSIDSAYQQLNLSVNID